MERETRILTLRSDLRADSQGEEMALVGYAALFNSLSKNINPDVGRLGNLRCLEVIQPGAFKRVLQEKQDTQCLHNHDANRLLGRVRNGTLQLSEDARGLKFRCQLDPSQTWHRDLYQSVKRGDLSECSFSFHAPDDGQDWDDFASDDEGRYIKRTLRSIDKLYDISVVASPAYSGTSVAARNLLRDVSFYQRLAQANLSDAELRRRVQEIGFQIAADQAKESGGFWECRRADGSVYFEPMTCEEVDGLHRMRAAQLAPVIENDRNLIAREEDAERYKNKARPFAAENPNWGPRAA